LSPGWCCAVLLSAALPQRPLPARRRRVSREESRIRNETQQGLPRCQRRRLPAHDGVSRTRFRRITLPLIRPALFLVLTLGLIGTWQVFDQVFLITQGNPAGTTLTPAFLAYQVSFGNQQWGQDAAIAFILFGIIVLFTILQRLILRERGSVTRMRGWRL
jgi:hypothetical protein